MMEQTSKDMKFMQRTINKAYSGKITMSEAIDKILDYNHQQVMAMLENIHKDVKNNKISMADFKNEEDARRYINDAVEQKQTRMKNMMEYVINGGIPNF